MKQLFSPSRQGIRLVKIWPETPFCGCGSTAECGRAKAETTMRFRSPAPFPSLWCSPDNMPASHAGDHRSEAGQGRQLKIQNNGVSEYDNAKRTLKERQFIGHFLTFFDRHRYPDWQLTDEKVGWFFQLQEK